MGEHKREAKESPVLCELNRINYGWMKNVCFLDQRKQAKMQGLPDPNRSNVGSLNSVKCEAIRHFRNKKQEFLENKIDELETNNKIKNVRDL